MKIKDIVSTVAPPAKIPSAQYSTSGTYPIIDQSQNSIAGYTNDTNKTITGNFILFGDHTCTVKLSPRTFAQGADGLKILKCRSGFDTGYIYYAIRALNYNDGKYRRHWSEFKELTLPIPPLSVQEQISELLLSIDKVINANCKLTTSTNMLVNLIYKYWFVQFDFPDENGRPYKSSGGKMVYNEQLGQEIPEGWHVSDLLSTSLAILIKPGINKFTGAKSYLATGDVIGSTLKNNLPAITYGRRETRANMQPKPNSIWFAKMKDSVKHITATDKSSDLLNDYIFSTGFCGLQARDGCLGYLFAFINQTQFEDTKNSLAHGATQKAISNKDLASFAIIEPTNDVLSKFESVARPMLYLMDNCRQESKLLASLRDWLLPMLMNGQVEIKNGQ